MGEERERERTRADNLTTVYRRWSWSAVFASAVLVVPRERSGTREPRASRSRPSTFPSRQVHAQATPTSTPGSGRPAGQRCNRDDRLFPFPGTQSTVGEGLDEETSKSAFRETLGIRNCFDSFHVADTWQLQRLLHCFVIITIISVIDIFDFTIRDRVPFQSVLVG